MLGTVRRQSTACYAGLSGGEGSRRLKINLLSTESSRPLRGLSMSGTSRLVRQFSGTAFLSFSQNSQKHKAGQGLSETSQKSGQGGRPGVHPSSSTVRCTRAGCTPYACTQPALCTAHRGPGPPRVPPLDTTDVHIRSSERPWLGPFERPRRAQQTLFPELILLPGAKTRFAWHREVAWLF